MDTINQVQVETVEPNYWVKQKEALERLENGHPHPDDFKTVILEGYFKDKAIAGTSILASDQIKSSGRRTDVMEGLIAISTLQDHFKVIKAMGDMVTQDMEEAELEEDGE